MSANNAVQDAQTTADDALTARAEARGMDTSDVLAAYRNADASAGNVLGGVWGHEAFFRAVHEFLGTGHADDPLPVLMDTDYYDFDKSVGGDGFGASAVDKRRCNTLDREVAVTAVNLRDAEMVGRFMALADEMGWAIEWGFSQTGATLSVIVAPSNSLDY